MEYIARHKIPKMPIRIEYQDDEYINLSSAYAYKMLKGDIERIKKPIIIHYNIRFFIH